MGKNEWRASPDEENEIGKERHLLDRLKRATIGLKKERKLLKVVG